MSDARAERLLAKARISFEREPKWIKEGQKPDFYCKGWRPFWCEVKTFEKLEGAAKLNRAFLDLRKRTANIGLTGQGVAYIHDEFSERDAKSVVHLLKRGLKRFQDSDAPNEIVALVPTSPDRKEFVRFAVSAGKRGIVEFHCCVSQTKTYGSPDSISADPFAQHVVQHFSNGKKHTSPTGGFLRPSEKFLAAILAWKHPKRFSLISASPALPATRLKTPERIREVLSDANDQFKNGTKYKDKPCVLTVFHDGLDVPDTTIITSALYGNLKFSFPEGQPEKGELILDKDGGWTPEKNRTTSAVLYIRNDGEPLLIHNYWARRPFPLGLFNCKEIFLLANGKFEEIDLSGRFLTRWIAILTWKLRSLRAD